MKPILVTGLCGELLLAGFNHGEAQPLQAENNENKLLHSIKTHATTIQPLTAGPVKSFIDSNCKFYKKVYYTKRRLICEHASLQISPFNVL